MTRPMEAMTLSRTVSIARGIVRLALIVQLVLGSLFWAGNATSLTDLHQLVGIVLVISLEVIVFAAVRAGVDRPLVVLAGIWGIIVVVLGLSQQNILTGSAHWVIRVLHLLVGLAAVGFSETLSGRIQQQGAAQSEPRLS
jgi:hypothetical protein